MSKIQKHGRSMVLAAGALAATFAGSSSLPGHTSRKAKCVGVQRW